MPAPIDPAACSKARFLFLYGTLMSHIARGRPARLVADLGKGRPAIVQGRLYAVREEGAVYPALVLRGPTRVKGVLHVLPEDPVRLVALDRFEDYDPRRPRAGDYVRQEIEVTLAGRVGIRAEAYIYRRPTRPGLRRIRHGDFTRYLAETGLRPFDR